MCVYLFYLRGVEVNIFYIEDFKCGLLDFDFLLGIFLKKFKINYVILIGNDWSFYLRNEIYLDYVFCGGIYNIFEMNVLVIYLKI